MGVISRFAIQNLSQQLRLLWAALQAEREPSLCMALVVGQAVLLGILR